MKNIDSVGVYIAEVTESSFGYSSGGCPQAVLRFKAEQKYVDDAETMAAFGITEAAYVPWDYDEGTIGFFTLFKANSEVYNNDTKLPSYDSLKTALGWDGLDFAPFGDGSLIGKKAMIRVEQREYNGKTKLDLTWIDHVTASPVRSLRPVKPEEVKAATAKLQFTASAPAAAKVVAAKVVKPGKKAASPPVVTSPPAAATASVPTQSTPVASPSKAPPARTVVAKGVPAAATGPQPCSKTVAWLEVSDPTYNGNADEALVNSTWETTVDAVAGVGTADEDISMDQWGQVRFQVLAALTGK